MNRDIFLLQLSPVTWLGKSSCALMSSAHHGILSCCILLEGVAVRVKKRLGFAALRPLSTTFSSPHPEPPNVDWRFCHQRTVFLHRPNLGSMQISKWCQHCVNRFPVLLSGLNSPWDWNSAVCLLSKEAQKFTEQGGVALLPKEPHNLFKFFLL